MTTWMNEDEIAEAVERFSDPDLNNLRRGAHTLRRLMRWTNEHSDGWPYWKKPAAAAGKLMELLDTKTREQSHRGDGLTDITDAELTKALSPIKAFLTREGVDHALILEEARSGLGLDDLPGGVNNPHPGVPAEPHTEAEDEDPHRQRAAWAATALGVYHDLLHGAEPFMGDGYGDEGSDDFVDALENLLVDLRHLAFSAGPGVSFPDIDERASERWCEELGDDEEES